MASSQKHDASRSNYVGCPKDVVLELDWLKKKERVLFYLVVCVSCQALSPTATLPRKTYWDLSTYVNHCRRRISYPCLALMHGEQRNISKSTSCAKRALHPCNTDTVWELRATQLDISRGADFRNRLETRQLSLTSSHCVTYITPLSNGTAGN